MATEAHLGPERVLENMMSGVAFLLGGISKEECQQYLLGIGIGVPGVVSLDGGTVSYPPNLPGWTVIRVGDRIREKFKDAYGFPKPVSVENDANVAALGEAAFGAGKAFSDFIMITLGTGVGGGIIINRKIYRGSTGAAGEIGHITIDYRSDTVHAGIRGTIEGLIGQRQLTAYAKDLARKNPSSILHTLCQNNLDSLDPKLLANAAEQNDSVALAVWSWVGEVLGAGLGTAVSLFDIRKFVVGGGVSGAWAFLHQPTLEQVKRFTLPPMQDGLEIVRAELGNSAGVMGAAALCM
ncbi:MAG: ROK family protein [Chlorobiales bacterium]|nr:ROK family protein [Chlorobiales bacterium]